MFRRKGARCQVNRGDPHRIVSPGHTKQAGYVKVLGLGPARRPVGVVLEDPGLIRFVLAARQDFSEHNVTVVRPAGHPLRNAVDKKFHGRWQVGATPSPWTNIAVFRNAQRTQIGLQHPTPCRFQQPPQNRLVRDGFKEAGFEDVATVDRHRLALRRLVHHRRAGRARISRTQREGRVPGMTAFAQDDGNPLVARSMGFPVFPHAIPRSFQSLERLLPGSGIRVIAIGRDIKPGRDRLQRGNQNEYGHHHDSCMHGRDSPLLGLAALSRCIRFSVVTGSS